MFSVKLPRLELARAEELVELLALLAMLGMFVFQVLSAIRPSDILLQLLS